MDPEKTVSDVARHFGIIIAFLLPGFIALWPMQHVSKSVAIWLTGSGLVAGASTDSPTTGGVLLVLLASLTLGMLLSAARWLLFDRGLHRSLDGRKLDWSKLPQNLAAFEYINENHYRYYQYYANSAVALLIGLVIYLVYVLSSLRDRLIALSVVMLILLILERAARDAHKKYRDRLWELMGKRQGSPKPERG